MARQKPLTESIATNGVSETTAWEEARDQLAAARKYWLVTVRPDGRPHVMPLFGVWVDDALVFTAGPRTRKARNLARNRRCVVAAGSDELDLIVEGTATRVRDPDALRRIASEYDSKYGWRLSDRGDGAFDAPYSAPSAGPAPYEPYKLTPSVAFGLGVAEPFGATRWRF